MLIRLTAALFALTLTAHGQLKELGDGGTAPVQAPHIQVSLLADPAVIAPNGQTTLGLVMHLEDHWHVYWANAGDAGEPPQVKWDLPSGVTIGPMQFPTPSRLPFGTLMDYGYEGTAVFPFALQIAPEVHPGPLHLDAHIRWLVCREVCVPGRAHIGLNLNVLPGATTQQTSGLLATAIRNEPEPLPSAAKVTVISTANEFTLTVLTGERETTAEFYPADEDIIRNAAPQRLEPIPGGARLHIERDDPAQPPPTSLRGIVKLANNRAYTIDASVTNAANIPAYGSSKPNLLGAIALAWLGGMILNLMPCVFPVLFIKGLSLVQSSSEERRTLRLHGIAYTVGILASFWLLVAVLLVLRAEGKQAGWGFQLQSPVFVSLMALLLFFLALSLAGQFELGLTLTGAGNSLASKQGYTGSFFTGVLATIVATPCTAPLMGAAIGFALTQSAATTFLIFTALALGLATPYAALTLQPAWVRWLPKPGAWMLTLKQLTALPLFASVIWLAWVYGHLDAGTAAQSADNVARLLLALLILAVSGWALGRWPAKRLSAAAAIALIVVAVALPLTTQQKDQLQWQPFSQQALDQARAQGHPVFIDFTAAWCLSCQVNERAVLRSSEIEHQLTARQVTLLRADWTQYDPQITAELASVGRSGVPTYVVYPAQGAPNVLPELLTKSLVSSAINALPQP